MNKFWHLVKFNLIFNRVSIAFLSFLALFLLGICHYFFDNPSELGESLMTYSFYIMFMIFTGKMNSKNSMMFDIKHMMALPLTKREIVLMKSFADSIQMFPIAGVFLYGFSLAFPEFHILIVGIILYLVLTLGNIIAFNKRIDFSRMQHSKASFKNSFLFLHKYLEMFIQIIIVVMAFAMVRILFEKNIFGQEYGYFVLICTGLFLAASNTLKMLKDETRSYFIFKRDAFRIGWKVVVVALPLFFFHKIYKDNNFLQNLGVKDDNLTSKLKEQAKYIESAGNKKFLLTIIQKDYDAFNSHLKENGDIPWDAELMGSYPPHLAAVAGDRRILDSLFEMRPDAVNMPGKFKKKTPIYSAIRNCKLETVEYLIERGANINHQDIDGETPVMFAAQRNCYGGVILLSQKGANLKLKNLKGKVLADYISNKSGLKYVLNIEDSRDRKLASKKKETISSESEKELPRPEQPHQHK